MSFRKQGTDLFEDQPNLDETSQLHGRKAGRQVDLGAAKNDVVEQVQA